MAKTKNTTTQQNSTSTAVTKQSTFSKPPKIHEDSYFDKGGTFIKDWLKQRKWISKSKNFGHTRSCRICDSKLLRNEHYLNLDQKAYQLSRAHLSNCKIQITICQSCVDKWSKELQNLNNDLHRSNTSEC